MAFLLFGLTGGLASGKSTVANRFRARGLAVIDADALARQVVQKGSEGLAEIVRVFGPTLLLADGTLDRVKMADLVFSDDAKRRQLNAILHPRIGAITMAQAAQLASDGHSYACYEAALLVENGLADAFRPLVVVAIAENLQISRAMARDGSTEEHVRKRLAAQLPLADKIAVADYVIDNSGDLASTERQADDVLAKIGWRLEAGG